MAVKLNTTEFIKRAINKHGDKYNYSKSIYIGSKDKIYIICKDHGLFNQTAFDHLSGCGCPKCDPTSRIGTKEFIKRSNIIHNNIYDYSLCKYGKDNYQLVKIICKDHGIFKQRPWAHLKGHKCPNCVNNRKLSNEEFINRCSDIHKGRYDYSNCVYNSRRGDVIIICKKHGPFTQTARVHLSGHGCGKCNMSVLEKHLALKLDELNIVYEIEKRFDECRNVYPLPFDFYIPLLNILIECDGVQHFKAIDYFGGEKRLEKQIINDEIKNKFVKNNNYILYRFTNTLEIDNFILNLEYG